MRARLRLALLGAVAAAALLAPAQASALTCRPGYPQSVIAEAEVSFVGLLTESEGDRRTFRVTEVLRGELPAEVSVRDSGPGFWGLPTAVGREFGIAAWRDEGGLVSGACAFFPPDVLRAGGWPPPRPSPPPEPAAEISLLVLEAPTARARRGVIRLRLGCLGRCAGPLVVRERDGLLVARRPIAMENESETVALRLRRAARRLLARRGRLLATVAGQRVTLLR